jgi:hypothetical protein
LEAATVILESECNHLCLDPCNKCALVETEDQLEGGMPSECDLYVPP